MKNDNRKLARIAAAALALLLGNTAMANDKNW